MVRDERKKGERNKKGDRYRQRRITRKGRSERRGKGRRGEEEDMVGEGRKGGDRGIRQWASVNEEKRKERWN